MRSSAVAPLLVAVLALASSGCGQGGADAATTSRPKCPAALKLGWQTLANVVIGSLRELTPDAVRDAARGRAPAPP